MPSSTQYFVTCCLLSMHHRSPPTICLWDGWGGGRRREWARRQHTSTFFSRGWPKATRAPTTQATPKRRSGAWCERGIWPTSRLVSNERKGICSGTYSQGLFVVQRVVTPDLFSRHGEGNSGFFVSSLVDRARMVALRVLNYTN